MKNVAYREVEFGTSQHNNNKHYANALISTQEHVVDHWYEERFRWHRSG